MHHAMLGVVNFEFNPSQNVRCLCTRIYYAVNVIHWFITDLITNVNVGTVYYKLLKCLTEAVISCQMD